MSRSGAHLPKSMTWQVSSSLYLKKRSAGPPDDYVLASQLWKRNVQKVIRPSQLQTFKHRRKWSWDCWRIFQAGLFGIIFTVLPPLHGTSIRHGCPWGPLHACYYPWGCVRKPLVRRSLYSKRSLESGFGFSWTLFFFFFFRLHSFRKKLVISLWWLWNTPQWCLPSPCPSSELGDTTRCG